MWGRWIGRLRRSRSGDLLFSITGQQVSTEPFVGDKRMHPNAFLQTLWRLECSPTVFVAMSFDPAYDARFSEVISPAITEVRRVGKSLSPRRVDLSSSGDSVIKEINDGIAHAQLIVADVSTVGRDSVSGRPYRNANVLYEVGIALACRAPSDVLLIRHDYDPFLFDVSTIPHATIDFTNGQDAKLRLKTLLESRLAEQNFLSDARVERVVARLSNDEIYILWPLAEHQIGTSVAVGEASMLRRSGGVQRLLDLQVIRFAGLNADRNPTYSCTPLGHVVAQRVRPSA